MRNLKVFVPMTAKVFAVGGGLGGMEGAWIAPGLAVMMNFIAYFDSSATIAAAIL